MKNRYFSRQALRVLLDTPSWRLVSSYSPPDTKALSVRRLRAWARSNVQTHAQTEIIIALSGEKCFFGYLGRVYPCRPGDILFIGPGEEHSYPYPDFYPDCDHLLIQVVKGAGASRTGTLKEGNQRRPRLLVRPGVLTMAQDPVPVTRGARPKAPKLGAISVRCFPTESVSGTSRRGPGGSVRSRPACRLDPESMFYAMAAVSKPRRSACVAGRGLRSTANLR